MATVAPKEMVAKLIGQIVYRESLFINRPEISHYLDYFVRGKVPINIWAVEMISEPWPSGVQTEALSLLFTIASFSSLPSMSLFLVGQKHSQHALSPPLRRTRTFTFYLGERR